MTRSKLDLYWVGKKPATKQAVTEYINGTDMLVDLARKYNLSSVIISNHVTKLQELGLIGPIDREERVKLRHSQCHCVNCKAKLSEVYPGIKSCVRMQPKLTTSTPIYVWIVIRNCYLNTQLESPRSNSGGS